ncbi:TIGR02444 family protein [Alteromonas pelagimontana]|uniref:TIGR02444 family protein n=1 Tax=Alteromonas pelagimontana TaxID=1858656 RepID=A0A6M4MCA9_9ALTE|nr:TIGR02444 family protein [Alteromonas pelagimontana]QJR80834.1 TIGR02444 family protein [Alteromonas pelagimontana]
MSQLTSDNFWEYSIELYGIEGVAAACLKLQDEHGVNINLLLLMCWCLSFNKVVTLKQWQILKVAVADTDQKLHQHRKNRTAAKDPDSEDHDRYLSLKHQELQMEAVQQQQLVQAFEQLPVMTSEGINGSLPAFIHLYNLRQSPQAVAKLTFIVKQIPINP